MEEEVKAKEEVESLYSFNDSEMVRLVYFNLQNPLTMYDVNNVFLDVNNRNKVTFEDSLKEFKTLEETKNKIEELSKELQADFAKHRFVLDSHVITIDGVSVGVKDFARTAKRVLQLFIENNGVKYAQRTQYLYIAGLLQKLQSDVRTELNIQDVMLLSSVFQQVVAKNAKQLDDVVTCDLYFILYTTSGKLLYTLQDYIEKRREEVSKELIESTIGDTKY